MKKLSFFCMTVTMIFVLLSSCLAKEPSMDKKGKWGISLSASGLSNMGIGLYQGGIGVKHWWSNSFVLKTILGVGGSRRTNYSQRPDYTDAKINQGSFSINFGAEFHFISDSKFSPYLYTGLNFTNYSSTNYNSIHVSSPPGTQLKDHVSANSFGLDEAIGLEYLFSKHLSLAGEYQFGLSFQREKGKSTVVPGPNITDPPVRKKSSFTIGAKTSSLILTFYF